MKKVIIAVLIIFQGQISYSQEMNYKEGWDFKKIIEYNGTGMGDNTIMYNLSSKSDLDRIFFGDTNSPVEFISYPDGEKKEATVGFRIIKEAADNSCRLEIFLHPNPDRALYLLSINGREIPLPYKLQTMKFISAQGEEWIKEYNKEVGRAKASGEIYEPYRVKPKSFHVSNNFAKEVHAAIRVMIDTFKAADMPVGMIAHGDNVTFRCVVKDELWTLRVRQPEYRAKQLSDVFRQLIMDVSDTKKLDESKYLELIKKLF